MLYNNDIMAMEESGYDVVSAFLDCPIYESYTNYVEAVTESGYMTEADKIKFRVLEEGALEAIGNALKKAWTAIANFFKFLAGKIRDFVTKISGKKIFNAIEKTQEAKEKKWNTMDVDQKKSECKKLVNGYASFANAVVSIEADKIQTLSVSQALRIPSSAKICLDLLYKDVVNAAGYKNVKRKLDMIPKDIKQGRNVKSKEEADEIVKKIKEKTAISINENFYKMVKMNTATINKTLADKCKSAIKKDVDKYKSISEKLLADVLKLNSAESASDINDVLISKNADKVATKYFSEAKEVIKDLSTVSDGIFDVLKKYEGYFKDAEQMATKLSEGINNIGGGKSDNGYGNRVINEILKDKEHGLKRLTQIVNEDKNVLSYITSNLQIGFKGIYSLGLKFAGAGKEADDLNARNAQTMKTYGMGESYDPWAEMGINESSFDPWAEIY